MGSSIWKGKCYVNKMPSAHPTPHCRPWFYMLARVRTTRLKNTKPLQARKDIRTVKAPRRTSEVKCIMHTCSSFFFAGSCRLREAHARGRWSAVACAAACPDRPAAGPGRPPPVPAWTEATGDAAGGGRASPTLGAGELPRPTDTPTAASCEVGGGKTEGIWG